MGAARGARAPGGKRQDAFTMDDIDPIVQPSQPSSDDGYVLLLTAAARLNTCVEEWYFLSRSSSQVRPIELHRSSRSHNSTLRTATATMEKKKKDREAKFLQSAKATYSRMVSPYVIDYMVVL